MVREWGGNAFRKICSLPGSFCFTKSSQASWSRASWPFHGVKGVSEDKVVGDRIFCLYLGIWFENVEIGSMIFGKSFSNVSFIKHGDWVASLWISCDICSTRGHTLVGWTGRAEQTIIQLFWDRSMERFPPWMRTFHCAGKGKQAGRMAWAKRGGLDKSMKSLEIV